MTPEECELANQRKEIDDFLDKGEEMYKQRHGQGANCAVPLDEVHCSLCERISAALSLDTPRS